ncbi:MAG TPA: O-antigen ligase family protein [Solirubrobacteraceae bacterium]|nr:O-antigen ligase family protein [Solirubrobacteraceae bacterium]
MTSGPAGQPETATSTGGRRFSRGPTWIRLALLGVLGLASGLSTVLGGFYDLTVWGPIAIVVFGLTLALVATGAARPRPVPALAVGGLAFLWIWSWISSAWSESADQAFDYAGRWALYAAALLAMVLLMKRRSDRWVPLACATAGVLAVGLYVVVQMSSGAGTDLFFAGRLRDPLGYVNGQAGYFLLGFWPCVALAEHARRPLLAGLGAAGAVVMASLLLLSQTRAVVPGLAVSAAVMLLLVPGRARRVWVLAVVGLALAAIASPLLDVYQNLNGKLVDPAEVRAAGTLILLAAAVVGAGWGAISWVLAGLSSARDPSVRQGLAWTERGLAAVAVVIALVGGLAVVGDPAERVSQQYDDFVNLRVSSPGDTRFLSGGGYRYDYWRVAWLEFSEQPLRGVGAGNYDVRYFAERRTTEDIRQPHSLPMQLLAELGLVGLAALLVFVGAVYAGLWRAARRGRASPSQRVLAVAAGGAFTAWLMHTSVDWLHLLPGVTGVAVCAAAGVLAPWSRRPVGRALATGRILAVVVAGVAVFAAADLVGRIAAADHYRLEARSRLTSDPVEALRLANQALTLNDRSVPALYIKSAAYARLGGYRDARGVLREVVRLEPSNPQPWALLGDIAVRRGNLAAAKRAYERAVQLDPKNTQVRQLAKDPRTALPKNG